MNAISDPVLLGELVAARVAIGNLNESLRKITQIKKWLADLSEIVEHKLVDVRGRSLHLTSMSQDGYRKLLQNELKALEARVFLERADVLIGLDRTRQVIENEIVGILAELDIALSDAPEEPPVSRRIKREKAIDSNELLEGL